MFCPSPLQLRGLDTMIPVWKGFNQLSPICTYLRILINAFSSTRGNLHFSNSCSTSTNWLTVKFSTPNQLIWMLYLQCMIVYDVIMPHIPTTLMQSINWWIIEKGFKVIGDVPSVRHHLSPFNIYNILAQKHMHLQKSKPTEKPNPRAHPAR